MRRENCLLKGEQGIFPYWFHCKRVDCSCGKMSVSEKSMQRDFVDKTAARAIDEHGAGFHPRKDARRNDTGCFVSQWQVKRDNIGLLDQGIKRNMFSLRCAFDFNRRANRIGVKDAHAEAEQELGDFPANCTETN